MLVAGAPARAHHSFAAEYDVKQPVTLKGVVTRIAWENPHTYIYIDVKDESGKVVNWGFEGYPPNTLRRTGWTKEMLKVGDTVSVTGWRAKDSSTQIAGREVTLPDGRKVFVGPAAQ
ncbi:MAG TPA: DUF6152 family protein [Bryobacteraceae bacterium]|nr:DUF6152 family protein [Bryobacteraceae bacterium]